MAIKSLNEAYEQDALVYLCNACGEVNDPDNMARVLLTDDEIKSVLSLRERNLFENYWSDDGGCHRYVLRLCGSDKKPQPAMALCFLFDGDWCRGIVKKLSSTEPDLSLIHI